MTKPSRNQALSQIKCLVPQSESDTCSQPNINEEGKKSLPQIARRMLLEVYVCTHISLSVGTHACMQLTTSDGQFAMANFFHDLLKIL